MLQSYTATKLQSTINRLPTLPPEWRSNLLRCMSLLLALFARGEPGHRHGRVDDWRGYLDGGEWRLTGGAGASVHMS